MHPHQSLLSATSLMLFVLWLSLTGCRSPEDALADHAHALSDIMDQHRQDPAVGVIRIEAYIQKHGPNMARQAGELMVEVDQLEGDAAEARLNHVNAALTPSLMELKRASQAFEEALIDHPHALHQARRAGIHRLLTFRDVLVEDLRPSFDLFVHIQLR